MRHDVDRDDASQRLHLLSRLSRLRRAAAAAPGGLLRFLFVRIGALSSDPGKNGLLSSGRLMFSESELHEVWYGGRKVPWVLRALAALFAPVS